MKCTLVKPLKDKNVSATVLYGSIKIVNEFKCKPNYGCIK